MAIFESDDQRAKKNTIDNIIDEIKSANASIAANRDEANKLSRSVRADSAPKWEYIFRDDLDEGALDQMGLKGWELVGLTSFTTGYGLGGNTSMKVHVRYVFKRSLTLEYPEEAQQYFDNIKEWETIANELKIRLSKARADLNSSS